MKRLAVLLLPALALLALPALLALLACDATNPVAPVEPGTPGAGSAVSGSAQCAEPDGVGQTRPFSVASASRNGFTLTARIELAATRENSLSVDTSDKALITVLYEAPAGTSTAGVSATVSTSLGFLEDTARRRVQQCGLTLNSEGQVVLNPGSEIGEAQILVQVGELSAIPDALPILEAPPPLTADFMAEPKELTVIFTDMTIGDPPPDLWSWDFDDGTCALNEEATQPVSPADCKAAEGAAECCDQNPVHTYGTADEYVVKLRVGRSTDPSDSVVSKFVAVGAELELKADFEADVGSGESLKVLFTNTTQGGNADNVFAWNFDDGSCPAAPECSEVNPVHVFPVAGEYAVNLTASNAGLSSSKKKLVAVGTGIPPLRAAFSFTVAEGSLTVQFVNESTGGPERYAWTFGDGPSSCDPTAVPECDDENPIHTYAATGEYVVTLEVTDAGGSTDLASQVIRVDSGEKRPVARFSFEILSDGFTVKFEDESENDPTRWSWNFGDGSCREPAAPECDRQNPSHRYDELDSYQVTLTAANGGGEDRTTQTVDLDPLAADFSFRQSGCEGRFTDRSTGNNLEYEWDFGDADSPDNSSDQRNPRHDYTCPAGSTDPDCVASPGSCDFGDYEVSLTIRDTVTGGSSSRVRTITIAPF